MSAELIAISNTKKQKGMQDIKHRMLLRYTKHFHRYDQEGETSETAGVTVRWNIPRQPRLKVEYNCNSQKMSKYEAVYKSEDLLDSVAVPYDGKSTASSVLIREIHTQRSRPVHQYSQVSTFERPPNDEKISSHHQIKDTKMWLRVVGLLILAIVGVGLVSFVCQEAMSAPKFIRVTSANNQKHHNSLGTLSEILHSNLAEAVIPYGLVYGVQKQFLSVNKFYADYQVIAHIAGHTALKSDLVSLSTHTLGVGHTVQYWRNSKAKHTPMHSVIDSLDVHSALIDVCDQINGTVVLEFNYRLWRDPLLFGHRDVVDHMAIPVTMVCNMIHSHNSSKAKNMSPMRMNNPLKRIEELLEHNTPNQIMHSSIKKKELATAVKQEVKQILSAMPKSMRPHGPMEVELEILH